MIHILKTNYEIWTERDTEFSMFCSCSWTMMMLREGNEDMRSALCLAGDCSCSMGGASAPVHRRLLAGLDIFAGLSQLQSRFGAVGRVLSCLRSRADTDRISSH